MNDLLMIPVRRVYKGEFTIPDFVVWKLLQDKEGVVMSYKNKYMTLTPDQLLHDRVKEGPCSHFLLVHPHVRYSLIYYKWKPDEQ